MSSRDIAPSIAFLLMAIFGLAGVITGNMVLQITAVLYCCFAFLALIRSVR